MMFTAPSSGGFTLPQLLLTLIVMAILLAISLPAYQNHVRKSKLQQARSALMENAQFMERFYQQHKTFKQTSTTWPALPLTATTDFCIPPARLGARRARRQIHTQGRGLRQKPRAAHAENQRIAQHLYL
jgi:Tfp pilus assembly protein PilE